MDAVLRNFKQINCPSGDKCSTPKCPLLHNRDREALDGGQDEDGPRKRRKVFSEPELVSTPAYVEPVTTKRGVSPPPLKRKALTATAPEYNPFISDPKSAEYDPFKSPVIEAGPNSTAPSAFTTSSASTPQKTPTSKLKPLALPVPPVTSTPSSSAPPQKAVPAKPSAATPRKAPRKPETLNPRHLKGSAPAAHDFRLKALKMLHDQFERLNNEMKKSTKAEDKELVLSPQELIWMALDEEEKMATGKPSIYTNVIKNRIMTYKRFSAGNWRDERLAELKKKEAAASKKSMPKSMLGPPKEIKTGLTPAQEVAFLEYLLTPIEKLAPHGYVPTQPSLDDIARAREGEEASKGWEECDRCKSRFQVFPGRREDGSLASGGLCVHHPGRAYFPERTVGQIGPGEKRYRCCGQNVGESPGCVKGATHVFKANAPSRLAALNPFMETPPNPNASKDRAVCFDCEMGYTSRGMELIRLTATSWPDGKELLDVLVQPIGEIMDLNSRYSGVWPEDIRDAIRSDKYIPRDQTVEMSDGTPKKKAMQIVSSPIVARSLFFSFISPETPLIGHGLENDLNAVRIIHPALVDTILLFPHRRGLPIRNGLKMLMEHHLNKAIQIDTGRGHDSAEDARSAGELVRLKVQEKWRYMQKDGWKLDNGVFVAPGEKTAEGKLTEKFIEEV